MRHQIFLCCFYLFNTCCLL